MYLGPLSVCLWSLTVCCPKDAIEALANSSWNPQTQTCFVYRGRLECVLESPEVVGFLVGR